MTEYTATTTNATNTVTATPEDVQAQVTILNGADTVANGMAATWSEGDNILTISVTNDAAQKTYTVTVAKTT